jgi:hypothetical protein
VFLHTKSCGQACARSYGADERGERQRRKFCVTLVVEVSLLGGYYVIVTIWHSDGVHAGHEHSDYSASDRS